MHGDTPRVDRRSDAGAAYWLPRHLLTVAELADSLGVARSTVTRWSAAGRIPSIRMARTLRFDPDEVASALRQGVSMNATQQRNREIRERACALAEQTWVAETKTGVIILVHPGGDPSILVDPERLRTEHGIVSLDCVKRLSESSEAPTPWSVDDAIARAEAELAELRLQRARREHGDAQIVARAEAKVAEARAEADVSAAVEADA